MKKIVFIFFCVSCFLGKAQLNLDSLNQIWSDKSKPDTVRLMAMWYLCYDGYLFSNPETSYKLAQEMYDYAKKRKNLTFMSRALSTQGAACYYLGKHDLAVECHKRSLHISIKLGNKSSQAAAFNNIANVLRDQGRISDALDYLRKALKISKQINNPYGISTVMGNIGAAYSDQNDFKNAVIWYRRSMEIRREINDPIGLSLALASIGNCFADEGNNDSAMVYQLQALAIRKKINNRDGMAYCYKSIGDIMQARGDLDSTMRCYKLSHSLFEELKSNPGITDACYAIGDVYYRQGNYQQAIAFGKRAWEIANASDLLESKRNASGLLYRSYKKTGQHAAALQMHELFITARDSCSSIKNQQALIQQGFMYEYEKKSIADSLNFQQKEKLKEVAHTAELAHEQKQRYYLYGGMLLLLVVVFIAIRSYRLKKKDNLVIAAQKKEVEKQKELVEEKNKEVLDSINYAKRLQDAILPSEKTWKAILPDSFILYQPKDIVAGDFYFMEKYDNRLIIAAADSTGHGVPGALVSVVCANALTRSIKEFHLTDAGKILDKTRELVLETFSTGDSDVKDGMDISLVSLAVRNSDVGLRKSAKESSHNLNPQSEITFQWAGANNPLWVIRNNSLIEFNGDKQPIGKTENPVAFKTHEVALEPNDMVYLFTDGYADQFGGPKGKKFKYSNLKELLIKLAHEPVEIQRNKLKSVFYDWKNDLEQIDDVCIIGFRV